MDPLLYAQVELTCWLSQQGIEVVRNWVAPDEDEVRIVLGRCCPESKTVWIRRGLSWREAHFSETYDEDDSN